MGATTIHELLGRVTSDVTQFVAGMNRVVSHAGKVAKAYGRAADDINKSAARITGAVALITAGATKKFADFESTMVRVGAVTRTLGTRDFAKLEEAAKKAGRTTRFTAQQSAEAMEALGRLGLNARQVIEALPGALQLASAAQIGIAEAATIAARSMRAFGLEEKDLTRINDTLVQAINTSGTDILQLAEALRPVGPVAKLMNVTLEETTAILAKMADAGFTGSLGGVALRSSLIRLAAPAKDAQEILASVGVNAADPLTEKLQKIQVALRGAASETEALAISAIIFGARAAGPMAALLSEDISKLNEFTESLEAAGGIALSIEQAQLNTLAGQFDLLTSAIAGVGIEAGGALAVSMRAATVSVTEFIAANEVAIVEGMVSAMRSFVDVSISVIEWMRASAPAIAAAAAKLWEFVEPLVAFVEKHPEIVAALVALKVAGFLGVTQAAKSTSMAVLETGKFFLSLVSTAAILTGTIGSLSLAATAAGTTLTAALGAAGVAAFAALKVGAVALMTALSPLLGPAGLIVIGVAAAVAALVYFRDEISAALMPTINAVSSMLRTIFNPAMDSVREAMASTGKLFGSMGGLLSDVMLPAVRALGGALSGALVLSLNLVVGVATPIVALFGSVISAAIKGAAETVIFFADAFTEMADEVRGVIRELKNMFDILATVGAKDEAGRGAALDAEIKKRNRIRKIRDEQARASEQDARAEKQRNSPAAAKARPSKQDPFSLPILTPDQVSGLPETTAHSPVASPVLPVLGDEQGGSGASGIDPAQVVADRKRGAIDKEASGFADVRDFLDLDGVTQSLLTEFLLTMEGVAPEMAAAAGDVFASLGPDATSEQLDNLALSFVEIRNETMSTTQALADAQPALYDMTASIESLHDAGSITDSQYQSFGVSLATLRDQLAGGDISAEQFSSSMAALKEETNAATAASKKKIDAEQREALLKGDFRGAGLDPKKALEDKIASRRMQQFNQGVDKMADRVLGVNKGMSKLTTGLKDVDKTLIANPSGGRAGAPGEGSKQLRGLVSFLSSPVGEATTLVNNISLLQQSVNQLSAGYNPAGYTRVRGFLDEIERLQDRLRELNSAPPVFSNINFGDVLEEQLTAAGGTTAGNGSTFTINTRSIHPDEIPLVVDRARQLERQDGAYIA